MEVRRNSTYEAIQVTEALKDEQGQSTIRGLISGVTQVELFPSRMIVSTRYARHDFQVGDWIIKDKEGRISRITDLDFKMNYEEVKG